MSLKEEYWKTGNIFELSTGEKRVVWNDNLIDNRGFIPKIFFNDNLVNTASTIRQHVVRVYSPNKGAGYFNELIETMSENLLWQKSNYIYTIEEIREKLNIPDDEDLVIVNSR